MRTNKKVYYHQLLNQYRSNIQGTWKVLNSMIKKGTGKTEYPNFYKKDNTIIDKAKENLKILCKCGIKGD